MLESLGPLHKVRLESGSMVEAQARSVVEYDKGAPTPKEGEAWPHLPTTETTSARTLNGEDLESRVTETTYDWTLRKPEETIVDPKGLNLRSRFKYSTETGQLVERSLPGAAKEGYDAHTTWTYFYKANKSGPEQCWSERLAGLPCMVMPAKQPGTEGQPELLVTKYTSYNGLDEPIEIIESPGGKEEAGKTRKTIKTYDEAGRPTTSQQVGGGTALPPTQTVYDKDTGLPVEQAFACNSECTAPRFTAPFGSLGAGKGQLNGPREVAADKKGHVWVVDRANNRVEEFDEQGEYLARFGSAGSGNGQFNNPWGIAVGLQRQPLGDRHGQLQGSGVQRKRRIHPEIRRRTKPRRAPKAPNCSNRKGSWRLRGGMLWVADGSGARVAEFREAPSKESERFVRNVSTTGTGNPGFLDPVGLAVDSTGKLWVADEAGQPNPAVQLRRRLHPDGRVPWLGQRAVQRPDSAWRSRRGQRPRRRQRQQRIEELQPNGTFLYKLDSAGSGSEGLSGPRGLALGAGSGLHRRQRQQSNSEGCLRSFLRQPSRRNRLRQTRPPGKILRCRRKHLENDLRHIGAPRDGLRRQGNRDLWL